MIRESAEEGLYEISSSYFVAGILVNHKGVVYKTAPILKRFSFWNLWKVRQYCENKHWKLSRLEA